MSHIEVEGDFFYNENLDYFRNADGILERYLPNGSSYTVRGFANNFQKNIFQTQTDIYLSYHNTIRGLSITLNHELIHAYHWGLGLNGGGMYSEYSATLNTAKYIPVYNSDLINMSTHSNAFLNGYTWPKYLITIK